MEQFILSFMTGLTSGGISCLAVQGGLLSSGIASSQNDQSSDTKKLSKTSFLLVFLAAKVLGMTILGGLLGVFGSMFHVSLQVQAVLQILLGVFMLATVGNILRIHPIFRYAVIQPPKAVFRFLRRFSKGSHDMVTPVVLGIGTLFIPCGVTQLMMASAIATQSFVSGALILGGFALGTAPLFFTLGFATAAFLTHRALAIIPALIIGYFGITSIDAGLTLSNSPYTLRNFYIAATNQSFSKQSNTAAVLAPISDSGKQEVHMTVSSYAYTTDFTTLKAGVPVHLTISSQNAQGCIRAFTIPSMNLTKILPETGTETIDFTPTKPGKLTYSCNMGMYTGEFEVVL